MEPRVLPLAQACTSLRAWCHARLACLAALACTFSAKAFPGVADALAVAEDPVVVQVYPPLPLSGLQLVVRHGPLGGEE
eukprot:7930709-Pyramimonas_sp.AAC.2